VLSMVHESTDSAVGKVVDLNSWKAEKEMLEARKIWNDVVVYCDMLIHELREKKRQRKSVGTKTQFAEWDEVTGLGSPGEVSPWRIVRYLEQIIHTPTLQVEKGNFEPNSNDLEQMRKKLGG